MKYRPLKCVMVFAITIGSMVTYGAPPPPPPAFFDQPAASSDAQGAARATSRSQESAQPSDRRAAAYPDRPFAPPPPPSPLLAESALTHLHSQIPPRRMMTGGRSDALPFTLAGVSPGAQAAAVTRVAFQEGLTVGNSNSPELEGAFGPMSDEQAASVDPLEGAITHEVPQAIPQAVGEDIITAEERIERTLAALKRLKDRVNTLFGEPVVPPAVVAEPHLMDIPQIDLLPPLNNLAMVVPHVNETLEEKLNRIVARLRRLRDTLEEIPAAEIYYPNRYISGS